jgi:hypothetical protein
MDAIPKYLLYFLIAVGSTGTGIIYWMAMENMKDSKHQTLYVFLLSIFLTPYGAWIVTSIVRMRRISHELSKERLKMEH